MPLCRRLDAESIAAAVEEKYPELGERLTTTVELAGHRDAYHGSPALIELVSQEAETKTQQLDFQRVVPANKVRRLAAVAGAALLLALSPALLWPDRYQELGGKLVFAWHTPAMFLPYSLEVTPGDVYTATGRPLTLAVRLQPRRQNVALPTTCTLVRTDPDGSATCGWQRTARMPSPSRSTP